MMAEAQRRQELNEASTIVEDARPRATPRDESISKAADNFDELDLEQNIEAVKSLNPQSDIPPVSGNTLNR
ncbi:MAG: hypothetical protein KDN22_25540 [Verrucomicrobiae bacterium]|nr:hypothetical protein [Verrucomicrobiae bacterium]